MINSAQSIEGASFNPEQKRPINYEHISSTPHNSDIAKVEEKLDAKKILDPINAEINALRTENGPVISQNPVSISKFVLEAKAIFTNFAKGLIPFAVPTKNAQELT